MNYDEAIKYIESVSFSKNKTGLERERRLLRVLGNPQEGLHYIHVAGSNGKGSTCAMLDCILRKAGYKTGLFTSPYLQVFNERIKYDGENISGEDLAVFTEKVKSAIENTDWDDIGAPTQFEIITAVAFLYYKEKNCDIVVLEVGLGGESDATNVISMPEVAVITNIGLEHTEYLGNTLSEIAGAKGGIIKPGCDAVAYVSDPEVMDTLFDIETERNACIATADFNEITVKKAGLDGQHFTYKNEEYYTPLLGPHQLKNAAVVIETARTLQMKGWNISDEHIKSGLAATIWPARFQVMGEGPFILDGGHNPQCISALADCIKEYLPGQKVILLSGILADKNYMQVIDIIKPCAEEIICVTPPSPRALNADELAALYKAAGVKSVATKTVKEGIELAKEKSEKTGLPVVAFGSLYLAGEILNYFEAEKK